MISKIIAFFRRAKKKQCGKCRYFEHEKNLAQGGGEFGYCVRYPPTLNIEDDHSGVRCDPWPRVFSNYSVCGDFKRGKRISS